MVGIVERPSPNFDVRPPGGEIDMLILHYTGMRTGAAALARLCDPEARVSAHYLIEEDGSVFRLVDEFQRAWHAGVSHWAGATDINARSIGVELVNPGHEFGYRPFPEAQMAALVGLCRDILARHPIPPTRVLAHSDVAPSRKDDPGELFDWQRLAALGIGVWPEAPVAMAEPTETAARTMLAAIGYDPDAAFDMLITAFQRHFRPGLVDGLLDDETFAALTARAAIA